jgi:hypothetical protein
LPWAKTLIGPSGLRNSEILSTLPRACALGYEIPARWASEITTDFFAIAGRESPARILSFSVRRPKKKKIFSSLFLCVLCASVVYFLFFFFGG